MKKASPRKTKLRLRPTSPTPPPEPLWTEIERVKRAFDELRKLTPTAAVNRWMREALTEVGKRHGYSADQLMNRGIIPRDPDAQEDAPDSADSAAASDPPR